MMECNEVVIPVIAVPRVSCPGACLSLRRSGAAVDLSQLSPLLSALHHLLVALHTQRPRMRGMDTNGNGLPVKKQEDGDGPDVKAKDTKPVVRTLNRVPRE